MSDAITSGEVDVSKINDKLQTALIKRGVLQNKSEQGFGHSSGGRSRATDVTSGSSHRDQTTIQEQAYAIWEQEGRPDGRELGSLAAC